MGRRFFWQYFRVYLLMAFHPVAAINNQHLQNAVIQMRKAANHPLLFHTDIDSILPADVQAELGASGKMILLERLLVPLLKKRHKVLIFSQFVTMLDIVCVLLRSVLENGADRLMQAQMVRRDQGMAGVPHQGRCGPRGATRTDRGFRRPQSRVYVLSANVPSAER